MENINEFKFEMLEFSANRVVRDIQSFTEKYFLGFTDFKKVKDIKKHTLKDDIDDNLFAFVLFFSRSKNRIKFLKKLAIEKEIDQSILIDCEKLDIALKTILRAKKTYILEKLSFYRDKFDKEQIEDYNKKVCKEFKM